MKEESNVWRRILKNLLEARAREEWQYCGVKQTKKRTKE